MSLTFQGRLRFVTKTVTWFTVFVFLATNLAQANILAPAPGVQTIASPPYLKLSLPEISAEQGKIEEVFSPANSSSKSPFVYLIQDAHDSLDAQENIRRILKDLVEKEKVSLICFEGGSQPLDRSFYEFSRNPEQNQKVWEELFREGELSGLERYGLEAPRQTHLVGVEDENIYFQNIDTIQKVFSQGDSLQNFVRDMDARFSKERGRLLIGEAKQLWDLKRSFDEKRLALDRYAKEISKRARISLGPDSQHEWPQLARLLKISELEGKLKKEDSGFKIQDFIKLNPVKGHLRWYFEHWLDSQPAGYELPTAVKDWIGFYVLQDELDAKALFEEIERLENLSWNRLHLGDEARKFLAEERDWELNKKLMRLELTRKEWEEVKNKNFPGAAADIIETAKQNYGLVERRDGILTQRFAEQISRFKARKAALVVGGFHADKFASFLKSKQIPYVQISPAIRDLNRKSNYRDRIALSQTAPPVRGALLNSKARRSLILAGQKAIQKITLNGSSLGENRILQHYYYDLEELSVPREVSGLDEEAGLQWFDMTTDTDLFSPSQIDRDDLKKKIIKMAGFLRASHPWVKLVNIGPRIDQNFGLLSLSSADRTVMIEKNPVDALIVLPLIGLVLGRSKTRAEFLAELYGRRLDPVRVVTLRGASFEEILNTVRRAPLIPEQERFQFFRALIRLLSDNVPSRGWFHVSEENLENQIPIFFEHFFGPKNIPEFTSFSEHSWLANDSSFQVVKKKWQEGKIQGVVGNLWGLALRQAAKEIYDREEFPFLLVVPDSSWPQKWTFEKWERFQKEFFPKRDFIHVLSSVDSAKPIPLRDFMFSVSHRTYEPPASGSSLGNSVRKTGDKVGDGNFELIGFLHSGGQGSLFLAKDLRHQNRHVVLKMLNQDRRDSRGELKREAELMMGLLPNENIPQVYEFYEGSEHFIVMEPIEGNNLKDWAQEHAAIIPLEQLAEKVLIPSARALARVHERQVVHSDVKPENIMIRDDGKIFITDFGLSSREGRSSELAVSGNLSSVLDHAARGGTLKFMAPERLRDEEPTPASDVWSFGVMLYWMVTGAYPFEEKVQDKKVVKQLKDVILEDGPEIPSAAAIRSDRDPIPVDLEALILKMLRKDPKARLRSMLEVSDAIQKIHWQGPMADGKIFQKESTQRSELVTQVAVDQLELTAWERAMIRLVPQWLIPAAKRRQWADQALNQAELFLRHNDNKHYEDALERVRFAIQMRGSSGSREINLMDQILSHLGRFEELVQFYTGKNQTFQDAENYLRLAEIDFYHLREFSFAERNIHQAEVLGKQQTGLRKSPDFWAKVFILQGRIHSHLASDTPSINKDELKRRTFLAQYAFGQALSQPRYQWEQSEPRLERFRCLVSAMEKGLKDRETLKEFNADLEYLSKLKTKNAEFLFLRARANLLSNYSDLKAAAKDLEEAIRLESGKNWKTLLARAELSYLQRKQAKEKRNSKAVRTSEEYAETNYQQALDLEPNRTEILLSRAVNRAFAGNEAGAIQDFERLGMKEGGAAIVLEKFEDSRQPVRNAAAQAFENLVGQHWQENTDPINQLLNLLLNNSLEVRELCYQVLVHIDEPAVSPLIHWLKSEDELKQRIAETALVRIGESAVILLMDSLERENFKFKQRAVKTFRGLIPALNEKIDIPVILRNLESRLDDDQGEVNFDVVLAFIELAAHGKLGKSPDKRLVEHIAKTARVWISEPRKIRAIGQVLLKALVGKDDQKAQMLRNQIALLDFSNPVGINPSANFVLRIMELFLENPDFKIDSDEVPQSRVHESDVKALAKGLLLAAQDREKEKNSDRLDISLLGEIADAVDKTEGKVKKPEPVPVVSKASPEPAPVAPRPELVLDPDREEAVRRVTDRPDFINLSTKERDLAVADELEKIRKSREPQKTETGINTEEPKAEAESLGVSEKFLKVLGFDLPSDANELKGGLELHPAEANSDPLGILRYLGLMPGPEVKAFWVFENKKLAALIWDIADMKKTSLFSRDKSELIFVPLAADPEENYDYWEKQITDRLQRMFRKVMRVKPRIREINLRYLKSPIVVFPFVLNPEFSLSSRLLAEQVRLDGGESVLDMGTGAGHVALTAAERGAGDVTAIDINPLAVANAGYNANLSPVQNKITVSRGNLFDSPGIPRGKKFDVIYFNPPFGKLSWVGRERFSAFYDENFEVLKRFLSQAKDYLKPGGRILISYPKSAVFMKFVYEHGFRVASVPVEQESFHQRVKLRVHELVARSKSDEQKWPDLLKDWRTLAGIEDQLEQPIGPPDGKFSEIEKIFLRYGAQNDFEARLIDSQAGDFFGLDRKFRSEGSSLGIDEPINEDEILRGLESEWQFGSSVRSYRREKEHPAFREAIAEHQKDFLKFLPEGGFILDAGAGRGEDSSWFAEHSPRNVVGIDFSRAMLADAMKLESPKLQFEAMSMTDLVPEWTRQFAGIWANKSFHHLPPEAARRAIREFHRVLGKDGILFLRVQNGDGDAIRRDPKNPEHIFYLKFYREQELKNLLASEGFEVIQSGVEDFILPRFFERPVQYLYVFAKVKGASLGGIFPKKIVIPKKEVVRLMIKRRDDKDAGERVWKKWFDPMKQIHAEIFRWLCEQVLKDENRDGDIDLLYLPGNGNGKVKVPRHWWKWVQGLTKILNHSVQNSIDAYGMGVFEGKIKEDFRLAWRVHRTPGKDFVIKVIDNGRGHVGESATELKKRSPGLFFGGRGKAVDRMDAVASEIGVKTSLSERTDPRGAIRIIKIPYETFAPDVDRALRIGFSRVTGKSLGGKNEDNLRALHLKRLEERSKSPVYAWLDDIDGNLTDLHTDSVPDDIIREYQQDLREGKVRALVSGRLEQVPDQYKDRHVLIIEEAAEKIRSGFSHSDVDRKAVSNLFLFPENATYVSWRHWDEAKREFVREEIDLVKHYGLAAPDFQMTDSDREEMYDSMIRFLEQHGFSNPFKFMEWKRYGFAALANDEAHGWDAKEKSRQASLMAEKLKELFAQDPKFKNYEPVATSVSVDVALKGINKMLAVRFMTERFGLRDDEIATFDDKASPSGNGYQYTERPGGFSTNEYDPDSKFQIALNLIWQVKGLEARRRARFLIKLLPIAEKDQMEISGKSLGDKTPVAVVFGGVRNMGRAFAEQFAKNGAQLVITGRDANQLQTAAKAMNAAAFQADVMNPPDVKKALEEAHANFGRVDDVIVNPGAAGGFATIDEIEMDGAGNFTDLVKTNFLGAWLIIREAVRQMLKNGPDETGTRGRITTISTSYALRHYIYRLNYTLPKVMMRALAPLLAEELKEHGISIVDVAPSLVKGPRMDLVLRNNILAHRKKHKGVQFIDADFDHLMSEDVKRWLAQGDPEIIKIVSALKARPADIPENVLDSIAWLWFMIKKPLYAVDERTDIAPALRSKAKRLVAWAQTQIPIQPPTNEQIGEWVCAITKHHGFQTGQSLEYSNLPPDVTDYIDQEISRFDQAHFLSEERLKDGRVLIATSRLNPSIQTQIERIIEELRSKGVKQVSVVFDDGSETESFVKQLAAHKRLGFSVDVLSNSIAATQENFTGIIYFTPNPDSNERFLNFDFKNDGEETNRTKAENFMNASMLPLVRFVSAASKRLGADGSFIFVAPHEIGRESKLVREALGQLKRLADAERYFGFDTPLVQVVDPVYGGSVIREDALAKIARDSVPPLNWKTRASVSAAAEKQTPTELREMLEKLVAGKSLVPAEMETLAKLTLLDRKQREVFGVTQENVQQVLARRIELFKKTYSRFLKLKEELKISEDWLEGYWSVYIPLSLWIYDQKMKKRPDQAYILGLNGGIGIGKTTRTKILSLILDELLRDRGEKTLVFSIDDLYKRKKEREPLVAKGYIKRGPPGTHDVQLGLKIFHELRNTKHDSRTEIPVFDKAIDDRAEKGRIVDGKIGIAIFEGWIVGANTDVDPEKVPEGFKREVAQAIREYKPLNDELDDLVVRTLRNLDAIKWMYRDQVNRQRAQVAAEGREWKGLRDDEIDRFVEYLYVDSWDYDHSSPEPSEKDSSIVVITDDRRNIVDMYLGERNKAKGASLGDENKKQIEIPKEANAMFALSRRQPSILLNPSSVSEDEKNGLRIWISEFDQLVFHLQAWASHKKLTVLIQQLDRIKSINGWLFYLLGDRQAPLSERDALEINYRLSELLAREIKAVQTEMKRLPLESAKMLPAYANEGKPFEKKIDSGSRYNKLGYQIVSVEDLERWIKSLKSSEPLVAFLNGQNLVLRWRKTNEERMLDMQSFSSLEIHPDWNYIAVVRKTNNGEDRDYWYSGPTKLDFFHFQKADYKNWIGDFYISAYAHLKPGEIARELWFRFFNLHEELRIWYINPSRSQRTEAYLLKDPEHSNRAPVPYYVVLWNWVFAAYQIEPKFLKAYSYFKFKLGRFMFQYSQGLRVESMGLKSEVRTFDEKELKRIRRFYLNFNGRGEVNSEELWMEIEDEHNSGKIDNVLVFPKSVGASLGLGTDKLKQNYGNSLEAVLMITDAAGRIVSLDLAKYFPEIYNQILEYELNVKSGKVVPPMELFLKGVADFLDAKEHALVISGPMAPEAVLAEIAEGKSLVIHYSDATYKDEINRLALNMIQKGSLTEAQLKKNGHFVYLPGRGLTEEKFLEKLIGGQGIDFDDGHYSLNRIKRDSGLGTRDSVTWLAGKQVIDQVLKKVLAGFGLPLESENRLTDPESRVVYDLLRLGLAVKLSRNPKELEKQGFVQFLDGRYLITEHFIDTFLSNAFLKQQVDKLVASMA